MKKLIVAASFYFRSAELTWFSNVIEFRLIDFISSHLIKSGPLHSTTEMKVIFINWQHFYRTPFSFYPFHSAYKHMTNGQGNRINPIYLCVCVSLWDLLCAPQDLRCAPQQRTELYCATFICLLGHDVTEWSQFCKIDCEMHDLGGGWSLGHFHCT